MDLSIRSKLKKMEMVHGCHFFLSRVNIYVLCQEKTIMSSGYSYNSVTFLMASGQFSLKSEVLYATNMPLVD